jgi:hypothetical protein
MRVHWLLRLYPRAWRERYEGEVTAVLDQHKATPRTALDLLRGILDARLDPTYRMGGVMPWPQRVRAASITVFAVFPMFPITTWAWAIGSDSSHDNDLLDRFAHTDPVMRIAQQFALAGLLIAFLAILIGALVGVLFRFIVSSRHALPRQGWRARPLALLALLPVVALFVAFPQLVLVAVLPVFLGIIALPFVPFILPGMIAGPTDRDDAQAQTDAHRAVAPATALVVALIIAIPAVSGALLRGTTSSRHARIAYLLLYAALIAVPCIMFAVVTAQRMGPATHHHMAVERLPRVILIPAAIATLAMTVTVFAAIVWTARVWGLPLDGRYWRVGILAEILAMASVTGMAVIALLRAATTLNGPREHARA